MTHTYSVELRIVGEISDERDISSRLGIGATSFFKKGEPKSPKRKWESSMWSFAAQPSEDQTEWNSLEEGLTNLHNRLLPVKPVIDELKQRYRVSICCGQFASGFGGGPSFSPELLKRLAGLEVELTISTYWHEESEQDGMHQRS
jgi:hypothetical protein